MSQNSVWENTEGIVIAPHN